MSKKSKSTEADIGTATNAKESASYQNMLEEVEGIVRSVSGGPLDLDEVVTRVETGYKLIKQMRTRLDATKAKIEKLRTEFEQDDAAPEVPAKKESKVIASAPLVAKVDADDEDDDTPF